MRKTLLLTLFLLMLPFVAVSQNPRGSTVPNNSRGGTTHTNPRGGVNPDNSYQPRGNYQQPRNNCNNGNYQPRGNYQYNHHHQYNNYSAHPRINPTYTRGCYYTHPNYSITPIYGSCYYINDGYSTYMVRDCQTANWVPYTGLKTGWYWNGYGWVWGSRYGTWYILEYITTQERCW